MIRFILKAGFILGLVALVLPRTDDGTTESASAPQFDVFTAMMGAQAAISDLAGFCDRAPAACDTGGAIARFAGERIGDGLALAYSFVEGDERLPAVVDLPQTGVPQNRVTLAGAPAPRDPLATGTIMRDAPLAMPVIERISPPQPLSPPPTEIGMAPQAATARDPATQALPIPRPAPRA